MTTLQLNAPVLVWKLYTRTHKRNYVIVNGKIVESAVLTLPPPSPPRMENMPHQAS